ncbi:MAG: hypothetical protein IJT91_09215 [Clostridia bacterium]|nr:hypothetical protein [Clostridia bacterium]
MKTIGAAIIILVLSAIFIIIIQCMRKKLGFFDSLIVFIDAAGILFALFIIGLLLLTNKRPENALYEFGYNFHWTDILKALVFLIPCGIWFAFDGTKKTGIAARTVSGIIAAALFVVLFFMPFAEYMDIRTRYNEYVEMESLGFPPGADAGENIYTVSGEVTDFYTPEEPMSGHDTERFSVGGVKFEYSGTEDFGYCKLKNDGGVITGDGEELVITYYQDHDGADPVICRIKELNSEENNG